jgi:hypothetical protein
MLLLIPLSRAPLWMRASDARFPLSQAITQIPTIATEPQNFALLYTFGNLVAILRSAAHAFVGECVQIVLLTVRWGLCG